MAAGDIVARAHARLLADHSLQLSFTQILDVKPPSWLPAVFKLLVAIWPAFKVVFLLALAVVLMMGLFGFLIRLGPALSAPRPRDKGRATVLSDAKAELLRPAARRGQGPARRSRPHGR